MSANPVLLMLSMLTGTLATPQVHDENTAQSFVVRTHVIIPRQIDGYVLQGTSYDPSNRAAGVGARFAHPDHSETRFDVYIYPAGQMEPGQALDRGMRDFIGTFQYATTQGAYKDLEILDRSPFSLPIETTGETEPPDPTDPLADIARALRETAIPGERLKLSLTHLPSNIPLQSRGYLFYRQMYYFKGRISAAQDSIDSTSFDALTDNAMQTLVPAISALNVGSCATIHIPIDTHETDERKQAEQGALALIKGAARARANNCTGELKEDRFTEISEGAEVVTIEFTPGEWGRQ